MSAEPLHNRPDRRPDAAPWDIWVVTGVIFAALYLVTCQRGVGWQDSGMYQWRVLTGDYTGRLGLALAHPLYIAVGQIAVKVFTRPWHLPLLLNAFSGLGMAVAVANLAFLTTRLTGRRWIGFAAAAMLGVAHTPWWLATTAEVYTWSLAGLTAELCLLVSLLRTPRWRTLALLAVVNGLGLSLHNFALLPLPVYLATAIVLTARRRLPGRSLAVAAAAWLAGAGLYLAFAIHEAVATGDLVFAVRSALFGYYARQVLNVSQLSANLRANAALAAMNFASLLAPLAAIGWVRFRRRLGGDVAAALAAITVLELAFAVRYPVADQFTFLLPSLTMIALAAGVGLSVLSRAGRGWRTAAAVAALVSIVAPPVFYAFAPRIARSMDASVSRDRPLPYRDELRYWLVPWKHNEHSAGRFARDALQAASPDGVILPDSTAGWPLKVTHRTVAIAPDVTVEMIRWAKPKEDPAAFARQLADVRDRYATRAIYIAGRAPDGLGEYADLRPAADGLLRRVVWKPDAAGATPSAR